MIQISEQAAEKIKGLITEKNIATEGGLRIYAQGGGCGCSSSSYGMSLENEKYPEDNVFETQGIRVLVDPNSFTQLEGASVNYYKDDNTEGFTIEKPHSHGQCGCGGGCNC